MSKRYLVLGLSVLAAAILVTTSRELRRHKGRRELKEDVQRWEDEGGHSPERNVPETTSAPA